MKHDIALGVLFVAALVISGCGSSEQPKSVAKDAESPPRFSKDVHPVEGLSPSKLFLSHLSLTSRYQVLNLATKLYVGDDVDRALEVFGPPPKAYDVTDLPTGWKEQGFRAAGWEIGFRPKGETSLVGFGAVLQRERLALAMFTVEHADQRFFGRLINEYQNELGQKPQTVANKKSRYRFWTYDDQVLMISATTLSGGDLVTVAMGAKPLMDGLRMNPDRAKEDLSESDRLLAARQETPISK